MPEYWAYTWLDAHRIRTIGELSAHLVSASVIDDLKHCAESVIDTWRTPGVEKRPHSLIAGAGIDLSGRLDCNHTECRRAQVTRLFRGACHYFQTIVARDAIAEDLNRHKSCPDGELRGRLLPHFETILIVRDLGAKALVEFLPRVPACFHHWQQHAREAGIQDIADRETEIVTQLLSETTIDLRRKSDDILCTLNNPDFFHTQWVRFSHDRVRDQSEDQIKCAALQ